MKPSNIVSYLLLFSLIVGIVLVFIDSPMQIIVPVVLFAVIVYCIKRPPAFLSKTKRTASSNYRTAAKQTKNKKDRPRSKTVPFKVIEGGRDDSDAPRYH